MTLLRHAVVITSLEEDFRRIGLIKEDHPGEGEDVLAESESEETDESDYDVDFDDDEDEAISKARPDSDEADEADEADESDESDEGVAMAEAVAFHESAKAMWQEFGEDGIETIDLDSGQMSALEGMGDTTTLPGGVIDETIDADDEDEAIDEDDDEDEGEDAPNPFESVSEAMSAIEAILDEDARPTDSLEEATPAFANLALISEKLYGFFTETAEAQDDAEYAEIAEAYKSIAQYSAAIVDTLKTESADTINFEALTETFQDYLATVLQGLETFAILREADEDEDEDEDDGEEQDEGDEGNG